MRADKALAQSADGLIMTDATPGIVTIYHEPGVGTGATGNFHVRLVPRDSDGRLNGAGTVEVGSYDDLDIALTIAAVSYGTSDEGWIPVAVGDLPAAGAVGEHAPTVEGRRISHPGQGESCDMESEREQ